MLRLIDGVRRELLLRALCLMLGFLLAAAASATPRGLRFERLSIEHGLSQESVFNILQDRQGFMWFGTQAGLNRFDGYKMTVFRNDPRDPGTIADNYVTASFEDDRGRLWFGTRGGLTRFEPTSEKFVHYAGDVSKAGAPGNRSVQAILGASGGGLWLATGDGLTHFDPATGRFRSWRHDPRDPASLRDNRVNALAVDGRGALWVGTAAGLDRLEPGSKRFEHMPIEPSMDARRNTVLSLSMGPDQTLWIGTASGLEAWRLGEGAPQRQHMGVAEDMNDARILTLYHDRRGNLWVGTDLDGLKWRDPATGRFVSYRNEPLDLHSLSDNQVGSIMVDRTGTLWAGTLLGGVNRTDLASGGFTRFRHAPQADGIGRNKVRTIADAGDGQLWLGTIGGGLLHFDPASGQAERLRDDSAGAGMLLDDAVTALAHARGQLWVGTAAGLLWRAPGDGSFVHVPLGSESTSNYIRSIREDRSGTLWIVTRGGLFGLAPGASKPRAWRHDANDPDSLGENNGYALIEDRHGIIWVGTDNGLERFDRATGKFTHFRRDPSDPGSLRHSRVYTLFESSRGELWVGTAGGLHRLETGADGKVTFRFFPVTKSNEAVPVGAVLEDESGALWVSTTVGITRLDPATGRFKCYTAEDGMIDGSYFVGSALRAKDGRLYFGGVTGMTSFMPSEVRDNPYPPAVMITDFLVFNRSRALGVAVNQARSVTLSHRDSAFALEFAALHYADPSRNRYAYQLEGFDSDWVEADATKRYASYTNLDPGHYVFRVRASNKDGVWNETPATLEITITPPLWKTWWFRTLAVALVLAAAYGGYRLRIKALVQQKSTLEREVGARTAELVLQKESAERRKQQVEHQKEVVEQAHRNISLLSEIGRKLTANLDREAMLRTLYEHVDVLMDASVFAVVLCRPERGLLESPFAVIEGARCAPLERALSEPHQLAAWCIANGREVFIDELEVRCADYLPDATPAAAGAMALPCAEARPAPCSLLYVPIVVSARVLGAVSVQSFVAALTSACIWTCCAPWRPMSASRSTMPRPT